MNKNQWNAIVLCGGMLIIAAIGWSPAFFAAGWAVGLFFQPIKEK